MDRRNIRRLEVKEIRRENGNVTFVISRQSHRRNRFAKTKGTTWFNIGGHAFVYRNVGIASCIFPQWHIGSKVLFVRGGCKEDDNKELTVSWQDYRYKILPAIKAYNEANGGFPLVEKKKEKPFAPQKGDGIRQVVFDRFHGAKSLDAVFYDDKEDRETLSLGLVFSDTDEGRKKAEARLEEIKAFMLKTKK